ncbi:cupin domain-containing protein [Sulfurimonas sp. CVO]|jgi:cupin 2 domain-containing protein|uniref:Cupin domain-containing protein n=1 Tax=Sulfurimonas xiamenensis TaxID=2590021 RepID=A0AAJ4DN91_9BACT|nr:MULTISPECIES: cupin domain-containing protein [Sulfurimonas]PLY11849.1 MAG: cupin [Sulfurimonas sp.]QFR43957.1 cupin domain-containing protein [Sulfurimonas xiamenensis]QHG90503.1 cupin domain-containing protein [Sulfurimonas sp. CVO]
MSKNIFKNIPKPSENEFFEELISKNGIKIERIISHGHKSSQFEWYNQTNDEWVILLQGEAVISFEDEASVKLFAGDFINIPAHKKHRVSWTKPDEDTIWLAVHY